MSDYKFHEEPERLSGPPVANELALVNLLVEVVFEWSDKILCDADYDESGNLIPGTEEYRSGWVMAVTPNQRFVFNDHSRTTIAYAFKQK